MNLRCIPLNKQGRRNIKFNLRYVITFGLRSKYDVLGHYSWRAAASQVLWWS